MTISQKRKTKVESHHRKFIVLFRLEIISRENGLYHRVRHLIERAYEAIRRQLPAAEIVPLIKRIIELITRSLGEE